VDDAEPQTIRPQHTTIEALNPSRNQITAFATMLNISNDISRFRTAKLKAMWSERR
jgi:hypothetical protein